MRRVLFASISTTAADSFEPTVASSAWNRKMHSLTLIAEACGAATAHLHTRVLQTHARSEQREQPAVKTSLSRELAAAAVAVGVGD